MFSRDIYVKLVIIIQTVTSHINWLKNILFVTLFHNIS